VKQALAISSIVALVVTGPASARYRHHVPTGHANNPSTEQAAAETPKASIFFPTLAPGNILEGHRLIMRQPWLSQESIVHWPLLIDVDRVPFTAWNKRIGE
jgi:hypothetical protein